MAEERVDVERLVERLQERADGAYDDDLSVFELEPPRSDGPRVRFRPELGFSSKRVVGRPITLVKRMLLRLQLYVFDDLAKQADEAIQRVERRLEVEIATRERLEGQVRELEERVGRLEKPQRRAR